MNNTIKCMAIFSLSICTYCLAAPEDTDTDNPLRTPSKRSISSTEEWQSPETPIFANNKADALLQKACQKLIKVTGTNLLVSLQKESNEANEQLPLSYINLSDFISALIKTIRQEVDNYQFWGQQDASYLSKNEPDIKQLTALLAIIKRDRDNVINASSAKENSELSANTATPRTPQKNTTNYSTPSSPDSPNFSEKNILLQLMQNFKYKKYNNLKENYYFKDINKELIPVDQLSPLACLIEYTWNSCYYSSSAPTGFSDIFRDIPWLIDQLEQNVRIQLKKLQDEYNKHIASLEKNKTRYTCYCRLGNALIAIKKESQTSINIISSEADENQDSITHTTQETPTQSNESTSAPPAKKIKKKLT